MGIAMCSPLGLTLANLFMSYHEDIWLRNCPQNFKPAYYWWYINDIIVPFRDKYHLALFKDYLNSQHQNIKFTSEEEENDTLPFLDVFIKRDNGSFTTLLYRKQTFSIIYTNFNSFLAKSYKLGLVFMLLHRSYIICSSYNDFHLEIHKLEDILLKNAYPLLLINAFVIFSIRCTQKQMNRLLQRMTAKLLYRFHL